MQVLNHKFIFLLKYGQFSSWLSVSTMYVWEIFVYVMCLCDVIHCRTITNSISVHESRNKLFWIINRWLNFAHRINKTSCSSATASRVDGKILYPVCHQLTDQEDPIKLIYKVEKFNAFCNVTRNYCSVGLWEVKLPIV